MYEDVLDELLSEEDLMQPADRIHVDRVHQIAAEITDYLITVVELMEYDAEAKRETMTLYYYLRTGRATFAVR